MKFTCLHGYFLFESVKNSDLSRLNAFLKADLTKKDWYYTFRGISESKDYALEGGEYLDLTASVTYEGKPWEIFEANDFVFDFTEDRLRLISEISRGFTLKESNFNYFSNGLIVPGSVVDTGERVVSYSGRMTPDRVFLYDWLRVE